MPDAVDIGKAYKQELDALGQKYRFDADNKEYDREKGKIHRKYALAYFSNGYQQEGLQLFANTETSS